MSDDVLKKLGFIDAYEMLFGTDEYSVAVSVTETAGEFEEWQEFSQENELKVEKYRDLFLDAFKNAKVK